MRLSCVPAELLYVPPHDTSVTDVTFVFPMICEAYFVSRGNVHTHATLKCIFLPFFSTR